QLRERSPSKGNAPYSVAALHCADLSHDATLAQVCQHQIEAAKPEITIEDGSDSLRFGFIYGDLAILGAIAKGRHAADSPFRFDAAIVCRIRSEVTSRSNWANESSTFRVNRPIEVVVLNCWVTETKETLCLSNSSINLAKSAKERVRRSTL